MYFLLVRLTRKHCGSHITLLNSFFFCCRHTFATLSFIAEIFLFLYVGMDALDIEKWKLASSRYLLLLILTDGIYGLDISTYIRYY
jgi:hypothetical protein